jgi:hypothetical protein
MLAQPVKSRTDQAAATVSMVGVDRDHIPTMARGGMALQRDLRRVIAVRDGHRARIERRRTKQSHRRPCGEQRPPVQHIPARALEARLPCHGIERLE